MRRLRGERTVLAQGDAAYPAALLNVRKPPGKLYVAGNAAALQEGLAVVGARKATPYGRGCARRFASLAARRGLCIISGGALGCDAEAHEAALAAGAPTVAFLGGGCDRPYPAANAGLFQRIVDSGGAVVSEHAWEQEPRPYMFRERNRLIAGLAKATLIVEAGLPSGTFSTADEALAANRDVLVVPGSIGAVTSRGANRLLYQGATPVVDDETFDDVLCAVFGLLRQEAFPAEGTGAAAGPSAAAGASAAGSRTRKAPAPSAFLQAIMAQPQGMDQLFVLACQMSQGVPPGQWMMEQLAEGEGRGLIARYPDGKWGPRG